MRGGEFKSLIVGADEGAGNARELAANWGVRVLRAWVVILAIVTTYAVVAVLTFSFPRSDSTSGVDAVIVLGPPTYSGVDVAWRIARESEDVRIILSVPQTGPRSRDELRACERKRVMCLTPVPFTTAGEARLAADATRNRGWKKIAVVTTTPHLARARYIFASCYDGEAQFVASPYTGTASAWAGQYLYQTGGFLKATVSPCS